MGEDKLPEIDPFPNGLWNILADSFTSLLKEMIHHFISDRFLSLGYLSFILEE